MKIPDDELARATNFIINSMEPCPRPDLVENLRIRFSVFEFAAKLNNSQLFILEQLLVSVIWKAIREYDPNGHYRIFDLAQEAMMEMVD